MPILSESELVAAVTRDRAAGKTIGFLPLAFDLLNVTHVRAVQAMAEECDRVVVAVVDDAARHVIKIQDRAEIAGCVRGVDYVIVCSADRLEPLAALLIPDVRA